MQHFILALTLLLSSVILAQTKEETNLIQGETVKVSVGNAFSDEGIIAFAFFNEENFMKSPLFLKSSIIENGNGKIDFQENGMQKESYGTSNNTFNFGLPQFDDSKFEVKNENLNLEIKF